MITDLDIWRVANLLVRRHGEDAATNAARRADKLAGEGLTDGAAVWRRVRCAVEELQRRTRRSGEAVN